MTYSYLLSLLPARLAEAVRALFPDVPPEELRVRRGRPTTLTNGGKTLYPGVTLDGAEVERLYASLCRGSVCAFEAELRQGFLPLGGGIRVGIGGAYDLFGAGEPEVRGVRRAETLVFRFPHAVPGAAAPVLRAWEEKGFSGGLLLWSPPGGGKTTVLRDLAASLAGKRLRRRVVVLGARREIWMEEVFRETPADVVSGLPTPAAIGLAVRSLSPEFLCCDEIGREEARAAADAARVGVPLVAAAHARSREELLRRPGIGDLIRDGTFSATVGIHREGGEPSFEIAFSDEADASAGQPSVPVLTYRRRGDGGT